VPCFKISRDGLQETALITKTFCGMFSATVTSSVFVMYQSVGKTLTKIHASLACFVFQMELPPPMQAELLSTDA
jgi:hypothetical protein